MLALALLLQIAVVDTIPATTARPDTVAATPAVALPGLAETLSRIVEQPRAQSVSDGYARRLAIHRVTAYTVPPLFVVQYLAGRELYDELGNARPWVRTAHRVGATGLAAAFTVNTVTGIWNLWETRAQPEGRMLRTTHALLMLAADAGFTYAGVRLSEQAENDPAKRRQHRSVALSSMGLATVGGLIMAIGNR